MGNKVCNAYKGTKSTFRWRAVGSFRDITAEVVSKISEANCYEVAFGVETISVSQKKSPKGPLEKLLKAIDLCRNEGIRVKCLLMLGLQNQTPEDVAFTLQLLQKENIPYRTTLYTPLHELTPKSAEALDGLDLSRFDRRTYVHPNHPLSERMQLLGLFGMHKELLSAIETQCG